MGGHEGGVGNLGPWLLVVGGGLSRTRAMFANHVQDVFHKLKHKGTS